jgi:hypothetical protein
MKQRMGTNQRQQRTEIPSLPNGECKNTIRQLLCKGDDDIPVSAVSIRVDACAAASGVP